MPEIMEVKTAQIEHRLQKNFKPRLFRKLGEAEALVRAGKSRAPRCFLQQHSHQKWGCPIIVEVYIDHRCLTQS